MGSRRELELAQTATAAASAVPAASTAAVGTALGRYRFERELGAGAMGVVYLAFDPDLERRIAIKVIKSDAATAVARDRLLREARAMARLSHPNVVTVYEVGTIGGRDFVAMELVTGETLAEWLRAARRAPAAILDAFIAAGRGLAAAHAAGIVHRDFKPHNVLRRRDGRIVVTDFGLARNVAADDAPAHALDQTLPASARPLALTIDGTLLGTPAYMAPEQWHGGAISPATDQFAYCVALWEALARARPYPGPRLEDLRAQIARGPAVIDAARIPRRLRALLRRGLDPDPARRWPSMEVLLTRLVRVRRRSGGVFAIAVGVIAGLAVLALALRGGDAPIADCDPPAREVAAVWSPAIRARMAATAPFASVAALDAAFWRWRAARGEACAAPPRVRRAQLACLDGVLDRFDVLRQAFVQVPAAAAEELRAALVEPAICLQPTVADVPVLALAPTPAVVDAYKLHARRKTAHPPSDGELLALAEPASADPCARTIATLVFDDGPWNAARRHAAMSRAVRGVDRCRDERLRAELRLRWALDLGDQPVSTDEVDAAIAQAELATTRVMQPELAAAIAALHRLQAHQRGDWDAQFRLIEAQIEAYRASGLRRRQLEAVLARDQLHRQRLEPRDLDAVTADVARWRPIAAAHHWTDLVWRLDFAAALARWAKGDLAPAHADLLRLWQARPPSPPPVLGRAVTGEVVDDHGQVAAGATVAAGLSVPADSLGIGLPFHDDLQITTTDARGRFALHDVVLGGPIVAQLGARRSLPVASADHVRLRLAPTRRVSGRVDLGGVVHTRVRIYASELDTARISLTYAPVAADGAFSIAGVSRGPLLLDVQIVGELGASGSYRRLPASPASVSGVVLAIQPATRALDVVVRSATADPIDAAAVWVMPGHWEIRNSRDLSRAPAFGRTELHPPQVGDHPPPALASSVRSSDLLQHVEHVPDGELTICACSVPQDLETTDERLKVRLSEVVVRCAHPARGQSLVVLDVPPQPRLD